jgi:hypothetical protein
MNLLVEDWGGIQLMTSLQSGTGVKKLLESIT